MISVSQLAGLVNGEVIGDGSPGITGVSSIEDAQIGNVVVAENENYLLKAIDSSASAVVTSLDPGSMPKPVIKVRDTSEALLILLETFAPVSVGPEEGIASASFVGRNLRAGSKIKVGHGAYIGNDVQMGDNVTVFPGAYIGDGVSIGSDVTIHPNVTIYPGMQIGCRVTIHAGSVIGADGFGYVFKNGGHQKVPQVGKVVIEDDVEIGANSAIDRAKFGVTRIGKGTKIDNLVHIAHNCKVGANSILIAQVGVAGSTILGNGVVMAGQSGVKDHVHIGDFAVIAARAGVMGDVASGAKVSGYPARNHSDQMRAHAAFLKLPDLLKTISQLESKIADLESRISRNGDDVAANH
jgi:UDP-3-O-[3-hydroxymyristoyl] glucosamine N-acyltransferase